MMKTVAVYCFMPDCDKARTRLQDHAVGSGPARNPCVWAPRLQDLVRSQVRSVQFSACLLVKTQPEPGMSKMSEQLARKYFKTHLKWQWAVTC